MNGIGIIAFVKHLHVWITKLKPLLMFFKLPILTSNNVIWVNFSAIFFDEIRHVVKTFTTGYVSVCYEIMNLFIEPQNFLLMFFICKLKGLYLIVMVCFPWISSILPSSPRGTMSFRMCFLSALPLGFLFLIMTYMTPKTKKNLSVLFR